WCRRTDGGSGSCRRPSSGRGGLLTGQVLERGAAGRQDRLFDEHAGNAAFFDRKSQTTALADEAALRVVEAGVARIERTTQHVEKFGTNHAAYCSRWRAATRF